MHRTDADHKEHARLQKKIKRLESRIAEYEAHENELKRVREELRRSEEKYRMAFEYTGTAMMVVESDTTISMANHRLDEVTGFPQEEGDSKHQWTEFVSPADYNRLMEYHRRRRENSAEVPTEYEFRLRHRSGNYKDILMNVSMIPGTDKSLISLIDITRLKEMERAVRKSERKYRDLIENANDIIYTHDLEGRFLSVNAAGARIYGYTEAEILEIGIEDIVDPGFLSEAKQRIAEKLKGRKLTEAYELLTRTKTGQPVWVELSTRLYYEDGKPVHIQGIARDITDRRRAEDQLHESERRFREIAELLPGIICETDLEMRLKYVNPRGLETFGLTAADIERGVNVLEFIHPDYYAKMETDIRNIFSGDFGVPQEYRMVNRQGEDKWILINSAPLMRNGEIAGIRSSLIDSTELKRAREARRESERLFRSVFRHSPIGIVLFADDGAIREANEAFWQLVKDDPAAPASGESVFKMLDMPPVRYRQLRTGRGLEHESRWGDGETARYFAWHVTPLAGETRDDCLYLAQVEDITERKRIEEETLARARDSAREAMKLAEGLKKQIVQISTFQNMVSRSPAMKAIFDLLPEMARTAATVLITGESGTGKELIARSLHKLGSRRKKPFIAINCSALPDNLLESELFGYKAGAFTDAKKDKPGKFVMAQGGVLFLDEIGDISPAMQAKLLRVLQEKTVEPLGDTRSMPVDVRVIAATNKDLRAMADSGEFREDLLYRLKVLTIELPPLRQRRGDIPLLCDHFIRQFNTQYNKHIKSVSREALDTLLKHEFPGNVRELVNVLEHAFIFCKEESIQRGHLPREFHAAANEIAIGGEKTPVSSMHDLERAYIANLLEQCNGNKTEAARRMGVHKSTLFRRLKSLGLVDG